MEANFSLRFPEISEAIFQELNNQTLVGGCRMEQFELQHLKPSNDFAEKKDAI